MSASPHSSKTAHDGLLKGNFYVGPQATDADRAAVNARFSIEDRKICIACGFAVRDDGHFPCGHDSI